VVELFEFSVGDETPLCLYERGDVRREPGVSVRERVNDGADLPIRD